MSSYSWEKVDVSRAILGLEYREMLAQIRDVEKTMKVAQTCMIKTSPYDEMYEDFRTARKQLKGIRKRLETLT